MMRYGIDLVIVISCLSAGFSAGPKQQPKKSEEPPKLTENDEFFLGKLLKKYLVDPKGLQRVSAPYTYRNCWGASFSGHRPGWLYRRGSRIRVYFTDGEVISLTDASKLKMIDYLSVCRNRYGKSAKKNIDIDPIFVRMRAAGVGLIEEPDVVHAAWLLRLGEKELAARALAQARKDVPDIEEKKVKHGDILTLMQKDLAWYAYSGMVHAFMLRADDEALAHGERLVSLYPDEAEARAYEQTPKILGELRRRMNLGTSGKPPASKPKDFDKWKTPKKITFLIENLDQVDARQLGQPGGVDLAADWRVKELIALGDAAVPALIDVIEKDQRFTRSVHFWRDFARDRTVLQVREAALTAVMSILRTRFFDPASTGDNFTARGEEGTKIVVAKLRQYWKANGKLPFDERMMKILSESTSSFEAKREAAGNLGSLGEDESLSTMFAPTLIGPPPKRKVQHPAVTKFKKPTAALAILAAMDKDLAAHDGKKREGLHDYYRRQIEDAYLSPLVSLQDGRIAADLVRRAGKAASPRMRRKWAYAAHLLGKSESLNKYIQEFQQGKITPKIVEKAGADAAAELAGAVDFLTRSGLKTADAALFALANPKHPCAKMAAKQVLETSPDGWDTRSLFFHPYCLAILRRELDNFKATDTVYVINKNRLEHRTKDGGGSGPIPPLLADPKQRYDSAQEEICDRAAMKLNEMVFGIPQYHPLRKDANKRLKTIKEYLDRYKGILNQMPYRLREALDLPAYSAIFMPGINPLGRPATAKDVANGKAVFHLQGKGKLVKKELPMTAVFRRDAKMKYPPRVLIVQAERGEDGKVVYGVIGANGVREVAEGELIKINANMKK